MAAGEESMRGDGRALGRGALRAVRDELADELRDGDVRLHRRPLPLWAADWKRRR